MVFDMFNCNWLIMFSKKNIFLMSPVYFFYFTIISPWKIGDSLSAQTWIPFTKESVLPSLIKFGQVVLEKMMEILKVYRQMDKQQATGKAHFSAGKLNVIKCFQTSINVYQKSWFKAGQVADGTIFWHSGKNLLLWNSYFNSWILLYNNAKPLLRKPSLVQVR